MRGIKILHKHLLESRTKRWYFLGLYKDIWLPGKLTVHNVRNWLPGTIIFAKPIFQKFDRELSRWRSPRDKNLKIFHVWFFTLWVFYFIFFFFNRFELIEFENWQRKIIAIFKIGRGRLAYNESPPTRFEGKFCSPSGILGQSICNVMCR